MRGAADVIVIDASRTLSICFDDEHDAAVFRMVDRLRAEDAIAPAIWALEVANGLRTALRRGRIATSDLPRLRDLVHRLPVDVEDLGTSRATGAILDLAIRLELTVYDASYLDLAQRRGLPLATADDRVRAAARRAGVTVLD